jgi:hypothetical protein
MHQRTISYWSPIAYIDLAAIEVSAGEVRTAASFPPDCFVEFMFPRLLPISFELATECRDNNQFLIGSRHKPEGENEKFFPKQRFFDPDIGNPDGGFLNARFCSAG